MSSFKAFRHRRFGHVARSRCASTPWPATSPTPRASAAIPTKVYKRAPSDLRGGACAARRGAQSDGGNAAVRVRGIYESPAPATARYEPGNPLADANGYVYAPDGQRGRGDGRHDLRLALVPEQRRSHEHLEGPAARHAAAGPGLIGAAEHMLDMDIINAAMVRQNRIRRPRPRRRAPTPRMRRRPSSNQEDFLTLMITQLKNQDPFKPLEPAQYVGQLAQFSQVSGLSDMNKHDQHADRQSCAATRCSTAPALIGRTVIAPGNTVYLSERSRARRAVRRASINVPAGASVGAARGQGFQRRAGDDAGARVRARRAALHVGRHHRQRRRRGRPAPTRIEVIARVGNAERFA